MKDAFRFTPPVYWNQNDGEFTLSPFGERMLFNNTTNVICALMDDHWAAIEIQRVGDSARLTFVQMPPRWHTRATFIVARLLDLGPHRLTTSSESENYLPHLCSWQLVQRWVQRFDIADQFRNEDFHGVADHFRDIIQLTMECSIEDWGSYNASPQLIQLASRLRTQFLIYLARRESQHLIWQKELICCLSSATAATFFYSAAAPSNSC